MNVLLDTDEELQCERCERPIEPGEPKVLIGFIEPHGGENYVMPYHLGCRERLRTD
jgi:hypothetical protein